MCVSDRESGVLRFHLNRRSLWNTDTQKGISVWHTHKHSRWLVCLPTNLVNCNYSRGSVLETLESRAVLWSSASARDVPYSSENQLTGYCFPQVRGRYRHLLSKAWNNWFWMCFSTGGVQNVQGNLKQLIILLLSKMIEKGILDVDLKKGVHEKIWVFLTSVLDDI